MSLMTVSGTPLASALADARAHIDTILDRARGLYSAAAPAPAEIDYPTSGSATAGPAHFDPSILRRAALYAADGIASDTTFDDPRTDFLADLGRDLRKYGIGTDHYAAVAEAAVQAVAEHFNCPNPGAELSYRRAEELGIPDAVTDLLHLVEHGIRITALGAADDEENGVPATLPAEVLEVHQRTPRITVVRLAADMSRPGASTGWAGQSLEVRTTFAPDTWQHLSSALPPNDHGYLEFHLSHPADQPPEVAVGDSWVVANPTGALEIPDTAAHVLMIAVDGGLAALRSLILDASSHSTPPAVRLYWSTTNPEDLHERTGLEGFDTGFPWFTFTVGTAADAVADAELDHTAYDTVLISGADRTSTRTAADTLTALTGKPQVIAEPR